MDGVIDEGGVLHAERLEDALLHDFAQPLAADAFDDLAAPVDVRAVFPFVARIEKERRVDGGLRCGDHRGLAVFLGEAVVGLVEEIVAEAGRVQHQHAGGDIALGRAELRIAGGVEAVDDLELADVGRVFLGRRVEIELALLDALQDRRAGDRLGGGEDREDAVGRHVGVLAHDALARRAFVDVFVLVGHHGDDAGYARVRGGDAIENGVEGRFQGHGRFSSVVNRSLRPALREADAMPPARDHGGIPLLPQSSTKVLEWRAPCWPSLCS